MTTVITAGGGRRGWAVDDNGTWRPLPARELRLRAISRSVVAPVRFADLGPDEARIVREDCRRLNDS